MPMDILKDLLPPLLHVKLGLIKQNKQKEREKSYQKLKRSPEERHTQTYSKYFMATDIFLNQKRVNVCEHMTKMASLESF